MTIRSNRLKDATLLENGVEVRWTDDHHAFYHHIWLRHSPGHPDSERPAGPRGRFPQDPDSPLPVTAKITPDGNLQLTWSNDRISVHDAAWLRENEYTRSATPQRRKKVQLWNAETGQQLDEYNYHDLAKDEHSRLAWFEHLLVHGAAIVRNVPNEMGTIANVANWLGHVPANLYADDPSKPTIGNVRVDPGISVATNMCHFLGPHTDTCWRQTLSGLVLLHCLKAHPRGGRSIVIDGFSVASRLREQNPDAFSLLARVPLDFSSKVDEQDDWRVLGRVISVDARGEIEGIRYNGNSIGQLDLPEDLIEPTYQALEAFESILYDTNLWWQPLLQPGDLLIVDNHRVLHGREAFDPSLGERHLQTCSVDRDDFHNNYRRLAKKMGRPDWNQRLSSGVI